MNYPAVLDYDQLENIPSFLEESEYVISGVSSYENQSISVMFANGNLMQVAFSYFREMDVKPRDFKKFDLSEDGQCIFLGNNTFSVSQLWEREYDERVIRGGVTSV